MFHSIFCSCLFVTRHNMYVASLKVWAVRLPTPRNNRIRTLHRNAGTGPTAEDHPFRIRPRRPPAGATPDIRTPAALAAIWQYARQTSRSSIAARTAKPYQQRCAVRVTYVANKIAGQWKAHGKYLARESATKRADRKQVAFNRDQEKLDPSRQLGDWQKASDPRLWKIIISPEFGEKLDLQELARGVMAGVEKKLDTEIEWIAVAHYNTGHPHVHVAMRGVDRHGKEVRLPKDLVRQGIREIAAEWCTAQLGYRTREQAIEARQREVCQVRYTSLDRAINQGNAAGAEPRHFVVSCRPGPRTQFQVARLRFLEGMGLARRLDAETWEVRRDFEGVLRLAQKTADRQRTLALGGVLRSDERLPIRSLEYRAIDEIDGRILVHGEEESGRSYMMLECTDGVVYAINHTRAMQELRNTGGLRVDTVVRLRKVFESGTKPKLDIIEIGMAEEVLANRNYLRQAAERLRRKGLVPSVDGWGGWLGRYQIAVRDVVIEMGRDRGEMEL